MRKAFLLFPILALLSTKLLAQEYGYNSSQEAAKGLIKIIREHRSELFNKKSTNQKTESLWDYYTHANDCSHCPRELELTRDINDVLQKLPLDDPQAEERVADLEFAFVTIMTQQEQQNSCYDLTRQGMEDLPKVFKASKTELLLETQLDPTVTSKYIFKSSDKTRRIYYYRGKGKDKDLVVKIELEENGVTHVSLLKLKSPLLTQFEKVQAQLPDLNPKPNPTAKDVTTIPAPISESPTPEVSNFQKCIDLDSKIVRDDHGFWKDLYVKQNCNVVLFDGYNINSHNEINARRVEMNLSLSDHGKTFASGELKLNHGKTEPDWKATIPLDLTIPAEIIREKNGDRYYTVLNASKTFDNKTIFTAGVIHENGKNNIELALEKALNKCEKVGVKYTRRETLSSASPAVMVTYENSFCR